MLYNKKTSKSSPFRKLTLHRRFYAFVFCLFLVFGLFNSFLAKNALANVDSTINYPSTNYLDEILWYKADDYPTTGNTIFTFHVKTTFEITGHYEFYYYYGTDYYQGIDDIFPTQTYTAGKTYSSNKFPKGTATRVSFAGGDEGFFGGVHYWNYAGSPMFWTGRISLSENPYPSLSISYPVNNDEIAGAFNIQGIYSIPEGSGYNYLIAGFFNLGTYPNEPLNFNANVWAVGVSISTTTGSISIPVNGIPAGHYDIYFRFLGSGLNYEPAIHILNVHLLDDIPYSLPVTGETTPEIPNFSLLSAQDWHALYSDYGTNTTQLFNTLDSAISPVIISIGQNLADFADKFSLTDAKTTGESLASSTLEMRAYMGSLNNFFGSLPVSQILILYFLIFVLVILFRVVKGLINLIKP